MSVQYISFMALRVRDLERSRRFYCEALGFRAISKLCVTGASPTAREFGLESLTTDMIFLERDGMRIQIGRQDFPEHLALPEPRRQLGYSHLGIRVEDLEAVLERVTALGGQVLNRYPNPDYGSEVAGITDPDGARMELLQMPGDPMAPIGEALQ